MSTKPHPSESALIFAWGVRDHSLWHLVVSLLVLMAAMAGFFFIFRIVHPVTQRLPVTPQHVISLDPNNPAELALIHRAQDRSFALLSDADSVAPVESPQMAFHPSFEGHEIKLRELEPATAAIHQPRLFTAAADVLPPVPRRAVDSVAVPPAAKLHAIVSPALAKRGPANVELSGINLTQPTRVQFRVAIGSAGQIITALPLSSVDDAEIMQQLHAAVRTLRFTSSDVKRVEWGEISFRWEVDSKP
ncbi:hypothetical protein [Prosthecobacter sp.]|uniref:hypothetical protein n=1 Tax=Prosthecobacter sp. TaxID=1965333 RepID=UPI00248896A9|nr:hypothetical protein [Prosthecobacter sp.]MDI1313915.1 hypothetical protein [Prosthecobacter sp.]